MLVPDIDENHAVYQFFCKERVPLIIECRELINQELWSPSSLALCFGESEGTVLNTITKVENIIKLNDLSFEYSIAPRRKPGKYRIINNKANKLTSLKYSIKMSERCIVTLIVWCLHLMMDEKSFSIQHESPTDADVVKIKSPLKQHSMKQIVQVK